MEEWTEELDWYLQDDKPYLSTIIIPVYQVGKLGFDENYFKIYLTALADYSLRRGENLFDRAAVYCGFIDEPHLNDTWDLSNAVCRRFEIVKAEAAEEFAAQLKEITPLAQAIVEGIRNVCNFLTCHFDERLTEVKNWCPGRLAYDTAEKRAQYAATGKRWWYCCGSDGSAWNYNLDHGCLDLRLEGWMRRDYVISGSLYWETTQYFKWVWSQKAHRNLSQPIDCYEEAVRCAEDAGDGFLFYPMSPYKLSSPVGSIRLELIRDAAEDYEYLWLLESLFEKSGYDGRMVTQKLGERLYKDLNVIVNPREFYAMREILARYIMSAKQGEFEAIMSDL